MKKRKADKVHRSITVLTGLVCLVIGFVGGVWFDMNIVAFVRMYLAIQGQ